MRSIRCCFKVAVITTVLGMAAIGGWPAYAHSKIERQESVSQQEGDRARVTVTAFVNISGNPSDDWWGIGIAEVVAVGLEGVVELVVEGAVSSDEFPSTGDGRGGASGPQWVITGTYQRFEDRIRLTAKLSDVVDDTVLESVIVDGTVSELFSAQDELVERLRRAFDGDATRPADGNARLFPGQNVLRESTTGSVVVPESPATMVRDQDGHATIRAVRLVDGLRLDGMLNESVYQTVPAISGFIQQTPNEGAPASEKTEAWIFFSDASVYVSGRVWDSAPESAWVMNEMRRDTSQLRDNDSLWVTFDTFHDQRNAVAFYTNPMGAIGDFAITNEGNPNSDWNPVWDVRTARFSGGWTVEMEIPFKSLRYRPGSDQVWGVQLRRNIRRKNERVFLNAIPISAGRSGIFRISESATMVGIEVPAGGKNVEIKPYAIGGVTTDLMAVPPTRNIADANAGLDVKYGITENLTADLTYNTDFAQVEVDEQQVNLTRFSLFFPEKREFFLEGSGIFDFARGVTISNRNSALRQLAGSSRSSAGSGNAPTLFYSRRIGLQGSSVVPIVGGGRVTGKVGALDVGALNIQTDDEVISGAEATNFTVVRFKRDVLRRSSVGALMTNRSVSLSGPGSSQTIGADGTFSFYENVNLVGYAAKTNTPNFSDRDASYQGRFLYTGDLVGYEAEHLVVEDNFMPEIGFLRRDNFRRSYTSGRYSPRPQSNDAIRQFRLEAALDYTVAADTGTVETRQTQFGFLTEFETSDRVGVSVAENYEYLVRPFELNPSVTLPVGGYRFRDVEAKYTPGAQRRLTGTFTARLGEYFNGSIRSFGLQRARLEVTQRLSVEPTLSFNWIDMPQGSSEMVLAVSRVNYTFTPRMLFSGLMQYNSSTNSISNNFRFRWEYLPGSELFVVYSEDRETDPLRPDRLSELRNRGFVIKINRLFRF